MAFKDQIINLIIQGKDLFSSAAAKSEKAITELADQSEKLNDRLKEIEQQRKAVDTIEDLTAAVDKGKTAYADSSKALDELQAQQKAAATTAKQLAKEQQTAATATDKLEQDYQQLTTELAQYDAQITATRDRLKQLTAEQTDGAAASEKQATAIAAAKKDLQQLEQAQTATRTAASQLDTELESQRQELQRISTATDAAAQAKAEYAAEVKLARSELSTLGSSLTKNQKSLDQQKAVLDKAGISMDKLADASNDLKQQQAGAETALANVNKRLEKHNNLLKESNKDASDFGGSIKSATASLLAMAGAYIGIDRLWESLKGILETGDRFAAFTAQMTAMMGSVEAGEQATKWIQDFANDTGSKLETVQQAFASLKAFGIDPMNGSLQSMTDYNAKLGGSQEKLEGIILAVGQAWAKQKLQGEEILQLVERGVPVWQLLEQVTGKNAVQLAKLSSAGKLGQDTIKALMDEMGRAANGQAAKSLDRLGGQINVLSNNWEQFKGKIADEGLYTVAIDFLKDLNDQFDELVKNGQIKEIAKQISGFLGALVKDGGSAIKGFLQNLREVSTGVTAVSSVIRIAFNVVTSTIATLAQASTSGFAMIMDGMAETMDFFGKQDLAKMYKEKAEALRAVSKAFKEQVEQDAKDTEEALKNIGLEITLSAENTADALDEIGKKSKEVARSQQKVAAELALNQRDQAQAELDAANKSVEAWKLRQKAANDYVEELKTKGAVGTKEFNDALLQLAETSSKLETQLDAQKTAQDKLGESQDNLKQKTIEYYQEQESNALKTLENVRKAFIEGKASVEEYNAAQNEATISTKNLAEASKTTNEEFVKILKSQAAWAENYAAQAKVLLQQGAITSEEYAAALNNAAKANAAYKAAVDENKESIKDYELEMAKAGITTQKVYDEQAESARKTYQIVKDAMAAGTASINEQRQAYLKWAEAEIAAAAASGKHVDAYVYQQAAALGLKNELQSLIDKNYAAESSYSSLALSLSSTTKETEKLKQAQKETADSVSDATKALADQEAALTQVTQNVTIFANEQQNATEVLDLSSKSVDELKDRYRELNEAYATNTKITSQWWKAAGKSADEGIKVEQSLILQTLRYRQMMEQIEAGALSMSQLDRATNEANHSFDELDDQMMENLRSAIAQAKAEMLDLRDELNDTVTDLQDELDELQGKRKDEALEELKQRQAELQQQLAEARENGDRAAIDAAEKALKLAQQIYNTKKQQAADEAKAAAKQAQDDAAAQKAADRAAQQSANNPAPSANTNYSQQADNASNGYSQQSATLYLQLNSQTFTATTDTNTLADLMTAIGQAQATGG